MENIQTCVTQCCCHWPETEMENCDWTSLLMKHMNTTWLHHYIGWFNYNSRVTWLALSHSKIEESTHFRCAWWGFWVIEINAITIFQMNVVSSTFVSKESSVYTHSPLNTEGQNHSRSYEWSWSSLYRKWHHEVSVEFWYSKYLCKHFFKYMSLKETHTYMCTAVVRHCQLPHRLHKLL